MYQENKFVRIWIFQDIANVEAMMVGHVIGLVELDQQYFGVLQDLLTFPQHFTMSQILNATHD